MHLDADDSYKTTKTSVVHSSVRGETFKTFLAMQKLKKAALSVIAKSLTSDEVSSLADIFRRIDQSGDGVMTLTELDDAISGGKFQFVPPRKKCDLYIRAF
jgi:Ca2+-binding EF-hand superfamily protein